MFNCTLVSSNAQPDEIVDASFFPAILVDMPTTVIETFSVTRLDILDTEGNADESLLPTLSREDTLRLYELMVLSRAFDGRALSLQREGRIGTYPSILGQEAAQVGSAFALEKGDWVFPSFRETGMHISRGYPLDLLFRYWAGDERGLVSPAGLNILPVCVSVGTHIPHAVGAAMAARYRKDPVAVVAYFGDGATSKGDFHEGFNMAGVFRLPVVFICQNNQWAISVPRDRQTAAATLAQKAIGYGFEGIQVDGNDVFAVYAATRQALERRAAAKARPSSSALPTGSPTIPRPMTPIATAAPRKWRVEEEGSPGAAAPFYGETRLLDRGIPAGAGAADPRDDRSCGS